MRITIFLFFVGFCLVSAKYLSYESINSNNGLLRVKRSDDSHDASTSEERKNSNENDDDDDNDDDDSNRDELKRKALERQEKEKRKREEEEKKIQEKQAKAQRKEEEKREKEERKRLEKLEKEKRKEEEKQQKQEHRKQEKQRKELEKLKKETLEDKLVDNDYLYTEEENSVELSDIWKEHVYVKYGLNLASTKLEKQVALNRYLEEELGISKNSTERERLQAVVQSIQNKLQTDVATRTTLKNQILSHINAASIQKLRADIDKDLEELKNKTDILNNVNLPWVPVAKQNIEKRRSFLQTISEFLSSILPSWITGGQNVQNANNNNSDSSPVNIPGVSNGPIVISENNTNLATEGNVATEISAIPESGIVVSTENNVLPSSTTDKNTPVVVLETNEDISSTSAVTSSNTEIGVASGNGDEIGVASGNGDKIATSNKVDNAPPENNGVANLGITNTVSNSGVDNEISSPALSPSASSIDVNVVSTDSDVSVTGNNIVSTGETVNVGNNGTLSSNTENTPSNLADTSNSLPASPSEPQENNNSNVILSTSTDSKLPVKPDSLLESNIPSSIGTEIESSATIGIVPSVNADTSNGSLPTPNLANDVVLPSTSVSQGNEVTSDISVTSSTINKEIYSANDANVISTSSTDGTLSIIPDAASSGNGEQVVEADTAKAPSSVVSPIDNQGVSDSISDVATHISNVNLNTDYNLITPDSNKAIDSSTISTIKVNATDVTDTSAINNVSSTPVSVVDVVVPQSIVSSESTTGTNNSVNVLSENVIDNVSNASVVTTSSDVPLAGVDVVILTESAVTPNTGTSVTSSDTVSVNNKDVASSNVETSPAEAVEGTSIDSEVLNSVNIVSSNGNNNTEEPVKTVGVDILPNESTTLVGLNDSAISNTSEASPAISTNQNAVDTNIVNSDTTIAPVIINSVPKLDTIDTSVQTASIVTESPLENGITTSSDIISNVNTVLTTVAETPISSEAPQIQTSQSSLVDAVSPVTLSIPVEVVDNITIPVEPGASVVEIVPQ